MSRIAWPCSCCGFLTRSREERGTLEICPICYWEGDYDSGPDVCGGANAMTLEEARYNFEVCGASEERFVSRVRAPAEWEFPS